MILFLQVCKSDNHIRWVGQVAAECFEESARGLFRDTARVCAERGVHVRYDRRFLCRLVQNNNCAHHESTAHKRLLISILLTLPRSRDGQDGGLRRVDDGGELANAEHAEVADAEAAANEFIGLQLVVPRLRCQFLNNVQQQKKNADVSILDRIHLRYIIIYCTHEGAFTLRNQVPLNSSRFIKLKCYKAIMNRLRSTYASSGGDGRESLLVGVADDRSDEAALRRDGHADVH